MPRRQNRITNRALELAGVQGVPGPDVSDDIQLVYTIGDLAPLMPALPLLSMWYNLTEPAVAGENSGFWIRPPADSALLINYVQNQSAQAAHFGLNTVPAGTVANVDAITFTDPDNAVTRAVITSGTNFGAAPGIALGAGAVAPANLFPMRLSPGNILLMLGDNVNTIMAWLIGWTEVPVQAPTL